MEKISNLAQIQQVLNFSQTVFVLLPLDLNFDKVAAATSLYLSLEKLGKTTGVFCSVPMTVEFSSLVGVNEVKNKLEGRDLIISFDYVEGSVEKVSYNIKNNKFNLVIQPKSGYSPLSPEKVQYSYAGGRSDLYILIGASRLDDLGEIYFKNKKELEEGRVAVFDKEELQVFCYSELIANFIAQFNLPADEEIATNLLMGMEVETNGFSPEKSGTTTFEAAAFCLRMGGQRSRGKASPFMVKNNDGGQKKAPKEELPPDWLAPKIYRGNTLV